MGLKKLGIVVVAALAVGALFASSALAGKPVTKKASWTTGTTKSANTIPTGKASGKAIKCKKTAGSPNFALKGTVFGGEVELTATGVECVNATIFNEAVGGVSMAQGTGSLKFTGISVVKPVGCKTPATNQTNLLIADLQMDETVGTKTFVRLEPDAAAGATSFTNVKLEECAAEGTYPVKGFAYCEATNATEVHSEQQECDSNTTTGGFSGLTFGGVAAFTGEITAELSSGGSFGAEEATAPPPAKPVTKPASWTTGTTKNANTIPIGTKEAIKCKKTAASPNYVLTGTVAGTPAELTATGVECVEATIFNVTESGSGMAKATGKLKFTGISVVKPVGCKTPTTLQTNSLIADLQMDEAVGTKTFARLEPDAAAGATSFATVKLEECAAEGNYPVKGFAYCEATNATEVHATVQECNGNATTDGVSSLTWGPSSATFSGEVATELSSGGSFGAEEATLPPAKPVTKPASWTTGTTKNANTIPIGTKEAIKCKKTAASPNYVLTGTVAGTPTELTATGVECVEATIFNVAEGGSGMANATGKLKFTGISVVKPAGCKTPATLQTNSLIADLQVDEAVGTKTFARLEPDAAAGATSFATVKLEECAAEGSYPVKGLTYCEVTNATEVHATVQECNGNATTNGFSSLTLGGNPATFTGEVATELSSGGSFGAEEATRKASWTTGTTKNANTIPTGKANGKAIKCRKTAASPNFTLTMSIAGSPIELTATGVECVEATIFNEVVNGIPHAKATGKIKFTGVSVVEPVGCKTPATQETNLLEGEVLMVAKEGKLNPKPLFKSLPDAAAGVTNFTNLKFEGCPFEGTYPLKGFTYCEATNETEVHSESQECGSNATTAADSAMTFGTSAAILSGEITAELTAGGSFGAEEF